MGRAGEILRFTESVRHPAAGPFGDDIFSFYVFTELILFDTSGPFGDPLSGLPERGERATASSQTAHPSFPAEAEKLSRSVAPPFPTKPTSLGFGGAPYCGPRWILRGNVDMICRIGASRMRIGAPPEF